MKCGDKSMEVAVSDGYVQYLFVSTIVRLILPLIVGASVRVVADLRSTSLIWADVAPKIQYGEV